MALYESNYRRLGLLVGDVRKLPQDAVSAVNGDLDLHLTVEDRSPYTSSFRLTYWFGEPGLGEADPDLHVRIYHDAHLAEAMSCRAHHRHRMLQNFPVDAKTELARRWQRNVLFSKWLEYCLERGHSFNF